jgi:hypothetical protein
MNPSGVAALVPDVSFVATIPTGYPAKRLVA